MKPGHPFDTDELDELRSAQRRIVRWMPDWLLDRHAPGRLFVSLPDADRAPLEFELRGRAADLIDEQTEFFNRCVTYGRANVLVEVLATKTNAMGGQDQARLAWLLDQATMERDGSVIPETDPAETRALSRFIFLAVIADELAGDYHDPRIRRSS